MLQTKKQEKYVVGILTASLTHHIRCFALKTIEGSVRAPSLAIKIFKYIVSIAYNTRAYLREGEGGIRLPPMARIFLNIIH
jgi:hypothetical protein